MHIGLDRVHHRGTLTCHHRGTLTANKNATSCCGHLVGPHRETLCQRVRSAARQSSNGQLVERGAGDHLRLPSINSGMVPNLELALAKCQWWQG